MYGGAFCVPFPYKYSQAIEKIYKSKKIPKRKLVWGYHVRIEVVK